jgi:hypothetical protein
MTAALHRLLREGVIVKEETLRYLSPYGAEHINRFGISEWNRWHVAPSLDIAVWRKRAFSAATHL